MREIKVLLVDDEEMILEVGGEMLKKLGYEVLTAQNGDKALSIHGTDPGRVDLTILDMVMPGIDGGRTFDLIREAAPGLPVILSSGYAVNGEAEAIMGRGCSAFIQKPFTLAELSKKVRAVLDDAGGTASSGRQSGG